MYRKHHFPLFQFFGPLNPSKGNFRPCLTRWNSASWKLAAREGECVAFYGPDKQQKAFPNALQLPEQ